MSADHSGYGSPTEDRSSSCVRPPQRMAPPCQSRPDEQYAAGDEADSCREPVGPSALDRIRSVQALLDLFGRQFWLLCIARPVSAYHLNARGARNRQAPTDYLFYGTGGINVEFVPFVTSLVPTQVPGEVVISLERATKVRGPLARQWNPGLKFALSSNKAYGNSHRARALWDVRFGGKGRSSCGVEYRVFVIRPAPQHPMERPAPGALVIRVREEVCAALRSDIPLRGVVMPMDVCNAKGYTFPLLDSDEEAALRDLQSEAAARLDCRPTMLCASQQRRRHHSVMEGGRGPLAQGTALFGEQEPPAAKLPRAAPWSTSGEMTVIIQSPIAIRSSARPRDADARLE